MCISSYQYVSHWHPHSQKVTKTWISIIRMAHTSNLPREFVICHLKEKGRGNYSSVVQEWQNCLQSLKQVLECRHEQRYREQRNCRRALLLPAAAFQFRGVWPAHKGQNQHRDELDKSGVRAKDPVPKPQQETSEPCWAGPPLSWAQELSQVFRLLQSEQGQHKPRAQSRVCLLSHWEGTARHKIPGNWRTTRRCSALS